MQTFSILGSTGSIGTQALSLIRLHPEEFRVSALTAHRNAALLFEQVRTFQPDMAGLTVPIPAEQIPADLRHVHWVMGEDALRVAAAEVPADKVLVSVVGIAGLSGVMAALGAGRTVLLANKESLVTGGHLVLDAARKAGKPLLPVDSEHSAIFQCLEAAQGNPPSRLLLTASGGPFRTWEKAAMDAATPEQALKHPNWSMGAKITIDSASMFNKGLEIIEARWLFDLPEDRITVVVHPQSIVHSAVEFADGAVLAQLGTPDMRIPIQYAMAHPRRLPTGGKPLNLFDIGTLTFEAADESRFPALRLARACLRAGGTACTLMNGANEAAVAAFLNRRIPFGAIARTVEAVLDRVPITAADNIEAILHADAEARRVAASVMNL